MNEAPNSAFPPRIMVWLDSQTGMLAREREDHEENGDADTQYLSLAEHEALLAEANQIIYERRVALDGVHEKLMSAWLEVTHWIDVVALNASNPDHPLLNLGRVIGALESKGAAVDESPENFK